MPSKSVLVDESLTTEVTLWVEDEADSAPEALFEPSVEVDDPASTGVPFDSLDGCAVEVSPCVELEPDGGDADDGELPQLASPSETNPITMDLCAATH